MNNDALMTFKPKGSGLYLKFTDGDEFKLRVLTLDPIVSESSWEKGDEPIISTKFSFIVWNFTEDKPQILSVGPGLLNRFVKLHQEPDLPSLNKMDVKIKATGEQLNRRYEVITLPEAQGITRDMLSRIKDINLDENIKDAKGRLSELEGDGEEIEEDIDVQNDEELTGYDKAKAQAKTIKEKSEISKDKQVVDEVFEVDEEEVNLDDFS